jgi:hypothetical protein
VRQQRKKMKSFRLVLKLAIASFLLFTSVIGCKSKFSEASPNAVEAKGLTLQERMASKARIDTRLNEVKDAAAKIKNLIQMFREIQNPSANEQVYTPMDFLIDANAELKNRIPENRADKSIRLAEISLPIDILSENCRRVTTSLESEFNLDDTGAYLSELLIFSLKTCASDGEFLDVIQTEWISNNTLNVNINTKNIETSFKDILTSEPLATSDCQITQGANKDILAVACRQFDVKLTPSETARFHHLNYSKKDDIVLDALADIYENQKMKATTTLKIYANGEVKFDVKKAPSKESDLQAPPQQVENLNDRK